MSYSGHCFGPDGCYCHAGSNSKLIGRGTRSSFCFPEFIGFMKNKRKENLMSLAAFIRVWTVWLWQIPRTHMVSPLDCITWDWPKPSQSQDIIDNPHCEGCVWMWCRNNLLTGRQFLYCMGSWPFMESAEFPYSISFGGDGRHNIQMAWISLQHLSSALTLCSQEIKMKLICVCIQEEPWVPVQLPEEGLVSHTYNRDIACAVVLSFVVVNCLMILSPAFQVSSISTYLQQIGKVDWVLQHFGWRFWKYWLFQPLLYQNVYTFRQKYAALDLQHC